MRLPCYFEHRPPQSRCSMWRLGCPTDKQLACPQGLAVVAGLDNEIYVPEACGPVEVLTDGGINPTVSDLLRQGLSAGYRLRKRKSPMGCALPEPGTRVEPFVVRENSLLAATPHAPIFDLLAGPHRVYEGDDGELYLRDSDGRWFHYLDERSLDELRPPGGGGPILIISPELTSRLYPVSTRSTRSRRSRWIGSWPWRGPTGQSTLRTGTFEAWLRALRSMP